MHQLSDETYVHTYLSLILSLLCIFLGYNLIEKKVKLDPYKKITSNKDSKIRLISVILFFISLISKAAVLIEKANFVDTIGYTEYYISYTSSLPFYITGFAAFYYISIFAYLSTLPSKKKAFPFIFLYILIAILSLSFGQRNGFVLDILVLLVYFAFRNRLLISEKQNSRWITKKQIFLCICILPFLLSILYNIGNSRLDIDNPNNTIIENLEQFFVSQGGSIHVITYGYQLRDNIPNQHLPYILGPIYDYLTQNVVSQEIFNFKNWQQDPIAKAREASLYGSSLAYILFPKGYLEGKGMGSNFIAELFHDYGYLGIIFGSFIIGMIIRYCDTFAVKKWWQFTFLLILIKEIIYIPRSSTLGWLTEVFSIPNIIGILIIVYFSNIVLQKASHRKRVLQ